MSVDRLIVRSAARGVWTAAAAILLCAATTEAGTSFAVNRIRTVAATGTPTENCQSLRDVLSSITDNSVSNRYLVQLEPGDYDCGTTTVFVYEGIALVGAGLDHTTIEGEVDNNLLGLIHVNGSRVQLRSLSVINQVNSPSQAVIGVSAFKFLGSGSINGIELRDVQIFGNNYSVKSNNAEISTWGAYLPGTVRHDGTDPSDRNAVFRYSALSGLELPGDAVATCYYCYDPFSSNDLDKSCMPP